MIPSLIYNPSIRQDLSKSAKIKGEKFLFIIAEAGVNHDGSFSKALKLIEKASEAGADCVKFQLFQATELATQNAQTVAYQNSGSKSQLSQLELLRRLELAPEQILKLKDFSHQVGIEFMCSAFDLDSLKYLAQIGVKKFKIPSGDMTDFFMLTDTAKYGGEVFLSTGMGDMTEIKNAIDLMTSNGQRRNKITLLQCTSAYPTPPSEVNLKAMLTLKNTFGLQVGLSDHTVGINSAVAATALGAIVIEKHFTLDKTANGPDHKASLDFEEFTSLVRAIKDTEVLLGSSHKTVAKSEEEARLKVRKSLVAKRNIIKGETFSLENLTSKRPGTGISSMKIDLVIGKAANRNFQMDEQIEI